MLGRYIAYRTPYSIYGGAMLIRTGRAAAGAARHQDSGSLSREATSQWREKDEARRGRGLCRRESSGKEEGEREERMVAGRKGRERG